MINKIEINLVTKSIRFTTKSTIVFMLLTIYTSNFYNHVYSVDKYNIKSYAYFSTHYKNYCKLYSENNQSLLYINKRKTAPHKRSCFYVYIFKLYYFVCAVGATVLAMIAFAMSRFTGRSKYIAWF